MFLPEPFNSNESTISHHVKMTGKNVQTSNKIHNVLKNINYIFSFSHVVFFFYKNALMILLVLHTSYKETLQNNTVICNNR